MCLLFYYSTVKSGTKIFRISSGTNLRLFYRLVTSMIYCHFCHKTSPVVFSLCQHFPSGIFLFHYLVLPFIASYLMSSMALHITKLFTCFFNYTLNMINRHPLSHHIISYIWTVSHLLLYKNAGLQYYTLFPNCNSFILILSHPNICFKNIPLFLL